jgi:hypothetical protein
VPSRKQPWLVDLAENVSATIPIVPVPTVN